MVARAQKWIGPSGERLRPLQEDEDEDSDPEGLSEEYESNADLRGDRPDGYAGDENELHKDDATVDDELSDPT